jgi:hypothetical protein
MRRLLTALGLMVLPAAAELPEFYKTVDRVVWVVKDLDTAAAGWEKAGFGPIQVDRTMGVAVTKLPNLEINWIQPRVEGPLASVLAGRGEGVFSLMHRVGSLEEMNREVERMAGLGVKTLDRGVVGGFTYVFFDTAAQGKYVLGLIHGPEHPPDGAGPRVTQFAFVARDTHAASDYWARLGWPAMDYTHGQLRDLEFRGQPGQFDQELGWQRHGKVVYEWIKPLKGPNVYDEHLKSRGEGFHHFGVNVIDMDQAIEEWKKRGFTVSQSGAWGEQDKRGSGRFAYIDTDALGGVTIELLWNYQPPVNASLGSRLP